MANNKLNGADYLLLLLYVDSQRPIKGAIRLMKMMFLFNQEIADLLKKKGLDSEKLPEFFAYDYGAFSKEVYEQIDLFKGIEFIKVENIKALEEMAEVDDLEEEPFIHEMFSQDKDMRRLDGKYYKYEIATNGINFIQQKIINEKIITPEQLQILEQFKKKINMMSPMQILKYTYTKYPEYTINSLIKDEVLGNE